jgi:hypothetical protein
LTDEKPLLVALHGYAEAYYNGYRDFTSGKKYPILDILPSDKHTEFQYDYILLRNDRNYTSFYSKENFKITD